MSLNKTKILYVEDDDGHALLMKLNILNLSFDFDLEIFRYSDELFAYLKDNYSDSQKYIIILDIRLPKIDGLTILRMLKLNTNYKDINVIMVSSTDNKTEIEQVFYFGALDFFHKPINFELLKTRLDEVYEYI